MNEQHPTPGAPAPSAPSTLPPADTTVPATRPAAGATSQRTYEQSGLYPAEGKAFRLWALLGWLTLVIVGLAVAAAILNIYYLGAPWKAG